MKKTPSKQDNGSGTKKTEMIEIRVPYEDKQAFMEACKATDETASAVLRNAISIYTKQRHLRPRRRYTMLLTGFLSGGALMAAALLAPALLEAEVAYNTIVAFEKKDRNRDGYINLSEYLYVPGKSEHKLIKHDPDMTIAIEGINSNITFVNYAEPASDTDAQFCQNISLQDTTASNVRFFDSLDTNGNKLLSLNEYNHIKRMPSRSDLSNFFHILDQNSDGYLNEQELWNEDGLSYTIPLPTTTRPKENDHKNDVLLRSEECRTNIKNDGQGELIFKLVTRHHHKTHRKKDKYLGSAARFTRFDLNGDGKIPLAEFLKARGE